jgi:uncharacterized protein YdeI (BOF family)
LKTKIKTSIYFDISFIIYLKRKKMSPVELRSQINGKEFMAVTQEDGKFAVLGTPVGLAMAMTHRTTSGGMGFIRSAVVSSYVMETQFPGDREPVIRRGNMPEATRGEEYRFKDEVGQEERIRISARYYQEGQALEGKPSSVT